MVRSIQNDGTQPSGYENVRQEVQTVANTVEREGLMRTEIHP